MDEGPSPALLSIIDELKSQRELSLADPGVNDTTAYYGLAFELTCFLHQKHEPTVTLNCSGVFNLPLICAYAEIGDVQMIETLVKEMETKQIPIDQHTYACILQAYCKVDDRSKIMENLIKLEAYGPALDERVSNVTIQTFGHLGMIEHMEYELEKLAATVGVSEKTFNLVLYAYGHHGHMKKMERLFATFPKPSTCTFNIMIHAYNKAKDVASVQATKQSMELAGAKCNQVTYAAIINALAKAGLINEMEGSFKEMLLKDVLPSLSIYSSIVLAYGVRGSLQEMECCFNDMISYNITPSRTILHAMIESYGRSGELKEMEFICRVMETYGIPLNESTFALLINGYGDCGALSEMEIVLDVMLASGMLPTRNTFESVLSAYGKAAKSSQQPQPQRFDVITTLQKMMQHEPIYIFHTQPKKRTAATTKRETKRQQDCIDEFNCVLGKMIEWGFAPIASTFSILLDSYGGAGKVREMLNVLKAMDVQGVKRGEETYMCLMKGFATAKDFTSLDAAYSTMLLEGINPTKQLFVSVIRIAGSSHMFEEMMRIYNLMIFNEIWPDFHLFNEISCMLVDEDQFRHLGQLLKTAHCIKVNLEHADAALIEKKLRKLLMFESFF